MDRVGIPAEFPWWSEGDQTGARVPTEAIGGRLGPPPLLRDSVRSKKCPSTTDDRSGAFWPGPLVDFSESGDTRPSKRYHLLTDDVLKDPFDPVELSVRSNKLVNYEEDSPPRLFPAFTTQPPPATVPTCHILSLR